MSTSNFSYCTRFVCCTINYKFSSLRQIFIISQTSGDGSSWSTVQSLTRLQSRCRLELGFLLRLGVLFQADIVVGRFHLLAAIEHIEAYFFKANGRLSLFRKVLVSLSYLFTNEVRPTQDNLPFDYLKCK